jgi:putative oxidoreductase
MNWLKRYQGEAYAALRIVTGFLFAFHGMQKIFGVLSQHPSPAFGTQVWFGGIIELLGGLAVMVGFQTRLAAFLCSGTMAVAYFQFHWKFQGGPALLPAVNEGELAALYAFVFLYIATHGPGRFSFDRDL